MIVNEKNNELTISNGYKAAHYSFFTDKKTDENKKPGVSLLPVSKLRNKD
jgi:hypothetical protein